MSLNFQLKPLALLTFVCTGVHAAMGLPDSAATNRILMIDPSFMPIAGGKATLIIGTLQRIDGIYSGDYKIKVSPYFFKKEKGRLAIVVSDESLTNLNQGKVTAIIGTATTSGKGGRSRHIDATATPAGNNQGKLKLWFKAGDRAMVFEPAYHFVEQGTVAVLVQRTEINPAPKIQRRLPESHRVTLEAADN
jgi:hypothetical protein